MQFVKRKWGFYITLLDRNHFKIKLLWFRAAGELSLQRHEHRGEAWCFLYGCGDVGLCEDGWYTGRAHSGDYWHIKRGGWHRFRAVKNTLVLEIQYGDKCIESDITRAE